MNKKIRQTERFLATILSCRSSYRLKPLKKQRGAAITELVVVMPALLALGLGVLQSTLFYQAKATVTYATFEAARKGAVTHGQRTPMLEEFGVRIAPIFGGDGSSDKALDAMEAGKLEALNPTITEFAIINPSQEAFVEFGVDRADGDGKEIPNTHLKYRDAADIKSGSGVNIQDANLLKIKTTYGFDLKVPLVSGLVTSVLSQFDPGNSRFYEQGRIPISAVATVRMQSEAWEDGNLNADGSVPGGGVVPNGEVGDSDPAGGDGNGEGRYDDPFGNSSQCDPSKASCVSGGGKIDDPLGTGDDNDLGNQQCGPSSPGSDQTSQSVPVPDKAVGNPINVVNGNKYQLETDVTALPGPLGLVWQRHYNSQTHRRGPIGTGWRHSYQVSARPHADGTIELVQADGRVIEFTASGDRYLPTLHSDGWLTVEEDTVFAIEERITWHWQSGQILQFNERGDLSDITLPSGEHVSLQYDDGHHLILIKDAQDRQISIGHYPNGRIKTVTDPAGKSLRYRYDQYGNIETVTYANGSSRRYHYEDKYDHSNLTGITNELGVRFATWEYDEQDRAISSTHADGVEQVSIDYSEDGTRLVTNSLGEPSTYFTEVRQGIGLVTGIQGPGCSSCSAGDVQHEYNADLQLVRTQLKDGSATLREYDSFGRTTRLTTMSADGAEHLIAAYEYGDYSGATARLPQTIFKPSVNPDARHSYSLKYNQQGQLIEMLEHGWSPNATGDFTLEQRRTTLDYQNGLLSTIDGPRNDVDDLTQLHYDKKGRLSEMELPDGRSLAVAAYDALGRPSEIRQGKQQPTLLEYNQRGDVSKVTQRGQTMQYQYDAAGQLVNVIGPDGESLSLNYDAAGRATGVTGPNGRQVLTQLDSENRVMENQLLGDQGDVLAQISYLYDAEGRLSQIQRNGETTHTREYDAQSNVASSTNAAGEQTRFEYSSLGELLAITQPNSNTTRLAYDAKNNLNSVTDARHNQTTYEYNDFGQRVAQHSPDSGTTRYEYDAAGNLTRTQDGTSQITEYRYDAANRMLARSDADGVVSYSYDPDSARLARVEHGSSVETFAYNRDAQLIQHSRVIAGSEFTTEYNYSSQGKLLTKQLPDGQRLNYHYHDSGPRNGTLRAITRDDLIGQTTIIGELNTNDTATLETYVHGNGIEVRKEHDGLGTATALSFGQSLQLSYQYDEAGRIVGIKENNHQNRYQYDSVGQLLDADTSLGRFEYQYDEVGNRTEKTVDRNGTQNTDTYEYADMGAGNALLSVNDEHREYNSAGNPTVSEKYRYEYNARQRPIRVFDKENNTLIAEYEYNSFGARIKKVVYGHSKSAGKKTVTYYLYDGRKLAAEVNEDGDIIAQYLYYKGQVVAKLEGRDVYAVHTDHLGTPKVVTDSDQRNVWAADYTPFGEAEISEEQVTLNLRLPGQYFDEETGGHYNYYRDYEPTTGRYTQSDPIGLLGGINTYAYVTNNPLQLTDILGLAEDGASNTGTGPEPGAPEADDDYSQKLEIVFDYAWKNVASTDPTSAAAQVLKGLRDNSAVLGAILLGWGAAHLAGVGFAADAILLLGGAALFGWEIGTFLKSLWDIHKAIQGADLCNEDQLKGIGNELAVTSKRLIKAVLEEAIFAGIGKGLKAIGNLVNEAKTFSSNSWSTARRIWRELFPIRDQWLRDKFQPKPKPKAAQCSFRGDTLVLAKTGYVAIRDIAVNDEVWSRNAANGEMDWKRVAAQYSNSYDSTVRVTTIDSATGTSQTIVSNAIHPYFVQAAGNEAPAIISDGHRYTGPIQNGAWVNAQHLKPGYRLLTSANQWQEVVSAESETKPLTAYNLTVDDYHTYFVAANDLSGAVWVHNDCYDDLPAEGNYESIGTRTFGEGDNAVQREVFAGEEGAKPLYRGNDGRYYDPDVHPPGKQTTAPIKKHPDGSYRTPDGKFASQGGLPAPGTKSAQEYTEFMRKNGFDVVGEELVVQGAVGQRRYDAVVRDNNGELWGIEFKSGTGRKDGKQDFNDMYINQFGAPGVGRLKGETVVGNITIYLP